MLFSSLSSSSAVPASETMVTTKKLQHSDGADESLILSFVDPHILNREKHYLKFPIREIFDICTDQCLLLE